MAPMPLTPTTPGWEAMALRTAVTAARVEELTVSSRGRAMRSTSPLCEEPVGRSAVTMPGTRVRVSSAAEARSALTSTSIGVSTPPGTPPSSRVW